MIQAKISRMWAVEGLRGMTYEDFASVLTQLLAKPDVGHKVALLDIGEVYGVGDLEGEHARTLLYQRLNVK